MKAHIPIIFLVLYFSTFFSTLSISFAETPVVHNSSLTPIVNYLINTSTTLSDEFEFIVFGDFNQGGCQRNQRVQDLITLMARQENNSAAFYVSTGDLIDGYQTTGNLSFGSDIANTECGNNAVNGNINKLLSPIKERNTKPGLKASFYPAIGNHDGGWGSGWYPDPWGSGICDMLVPNTPMDFINHSVANINTSLENDLIEPTTTNKDSINTLFCNKQNAQSSLHPDEFYYSFSYKNSYFIFLSLYHDYQDPANNPRQLAFLEQQLIYAQANKQHIFVFAHAPLYTTNLDRHPATEYWRIYAELFEQYGVDIYFNGHNHSYERSYALKTDPNDEQKYIRNDQGTVYLTVGSAGGESDGSPDVSAALTEVTAHVPTWAQVKTWSKNAYAREITVYLKVKVKNNNVSFEAINIGLESLDSINDGGNLIPMDQIILGPRTVDQGFLRKYQ